VVRRLSHLAVGNPKTETAAAHAVDVDQLRGFTSDDIVRGYIVVGAG
jgi:hypothetical protein